MPSPIEETFKKEAVIAVLSRLGEDPFSTIRLSLNDQYQINLDKPDTYSLSKLHAALTVLIGENGAAMITREIREEIKLLARSQTH